MTRAAARRTPGAAAVATPPDLAGSGRTSAASEQWNLRLYIAGQTPGSVRAVDNLRRVCEEHLAGRFHVEVIDLLENPQLARGDQIIAVPTLVRGLPEPVRRIIGDLSDTERVLVGLQIRPEPGGAE